MESSQTSTQTFKNALSAFIKCTSNTELKQIELIINDFIIKNSNSILEIIKILEENQNIAINQLLTILLKKSIKKNYLKNSEQKNLILQKIWELYIKFEKNSKILTQLSNSIALIYKCENRNFSNSPEIGKFLEKNLNFSNKDQFLSSMIILQNIINFCPTFFENEQIKNLIQKIQTVFNTDYNASQNEIYLFSMRSLFVFLKSFLEDNIYNSNEIYDYILNVFKIGQNLILNEDFIFEERNDVQDMLINFFDDLSENIEIQNPKLKKESLQIILDFILSNVILDNENFEDNVKCSAIEIIGVINNSFPDFYNPKICKLNYLEKTLDVFVKLLTKEHNDTEEKIKNGVENKLDNFLSEKMSRLIFMSLDSLTIDLRTKNIFEILSKVKNYFIQNKQIKMLLMFLSATVEQFSLFYIKELDFLMNEIIFPSLNSEREDIVLYGLRTLCFFSEYLVPNILDYQKDLIDIFVKFLDKSKNLQNDDYSRRVKIAIVEQTLYAMELIIENIEPEDLKENSFFIIEKIILVMNEEKLNDTTKKIAIGTLSSVFASSLEKELLKNLEKLIFILQPLLANEFLLGETLRCIGKLSFYSLQNCENPDFLYNKHFNVFLEKSLQIANNLETTIYDFEIYEGSLTIIYNCIELLKRKSSYMFDKNLFFKWIRYIDEARLDEIVEPEENNLFDEENEQKNINMIAKLPFIYMIAAGLKYIGTVLRILPDLVLENEKVYEEIKQFLGFKIIAEHMDERFQAFSGSLNMILGTYEYMGKNIQLESLNVFEVALTNEKSDCNLQRNIEQFKDFIISASKIKNGNILFEDEKFLKQLSFIINVFLKNNYEKELNPELYIEISLLITEIMKLSKSENCLTFLQNVFLSITFPGKDGEDFDLIVIEEMYGMIAEIIFYHPTSLKVFLEIYDKNSEFQNFALKSQYYQDESIARNGIYLIGEIFEKMKLPFWSDKNKLTTIINLVNNCYANATMQELKDNSVSTILKLFLNTDYKDIISDQISNEKMFEILFDILPLKGDKEETSSLLKGLLYFLNIESYRNKILSEKKIILFFIHSILDKKNLGVKGEVLENVVKIVKGNLGNESFVAVLNSLEQNSQISLKAVLDQF